MIKWHHYIFRSSNRNELPEKGKIMTKNENKIEIHSFQDKWLL